MKFTDSHLSVPEKELPPEGASVPEIGIGTSIRTYRTAAGMRQVDLARKSGISAVGISHIERGLSEPRASTVRALAKALGCTPSLLRGNFDG